MSPQELIQEAQAATVRLGAATMDRLGEQDAARLDAARARVNETAAEVEAKVERAADAVLNDPVTRAWVLGAAAGATATAVVMWLWRRRRQRPLEQELRYESSAEGVPGWTDPQAAFSEPSVS